MLVLVLAGLGLLLSGYLSYWNLWGPSCHAGPLSWLVSCGGPQKVLIFGLPTCVYGFFMYLAVAITALVGLTAVRSQGALKTLVGLGILGTLFAGGLTVYELFIIKLKFEALPACVYGLILYAGILATSSAAYKKITRSGITTPPPTMPTSSSPNP